MPSSLLIVITHDCLYFVDPSNMVRNSYFILRETNELFQEILEQYGFEVLSTWGCTNTTFNVKVGSLMKPVNLIFNTAQGSEICLVLKSRVQSDKSARKYATPPTTPASPTTPPAPFAVDTATKDAAQAPREVKKPVVPTLQLNRAKMFNFE